jgi:prophage tail gpP-like protein
VGRRLPTTRDVVGVEIQNRSWRHWDDLEVHLSLDAHPSVGFASPFDPTRREFREAFRPCSFTPLGLTLDEEELFTGVLVNVRPQSRADSAVVQCDGYSRPATLEDVNLPGDQMPFEAAGLTLQQIAERLAGIYSIGVTMAADGGPPFRKVNAKRWKSKVDTKVDQDTKIDSFLVELAKQRGLVRTSDHKGNLLFWQSVKPGNPVARLIEGKPPLLEVTSTFSPQDYYSEITGYTLAKRGMTGSRFTQRNDRLAGTVLRTLTFKLDDVEKGDAPAAVRMKVGRMFGNAVTYVLQLPTWRDPSGRLFQPNTTISVYAPRAMIYRETELLIRDVYLKQSQGQRTCSLGCVLPGSFSGEIPEHMPWDEP